MEANKEKEADALLVRIKHSKPIELSDFVTSLNAVGNLFSSFARKKGEWKVQMQSKLYVEKIEEGSIDIVLREAVTAGIIPFMENVNIILEFALYIKCIIEFYTQNKGEKPDLDLQECRSVKDLLNITANDINGETAISAIYFENKDAKFNNCTFNFSGSNAGQNLLNREIEQNKTKSADEVEYKRVLMTIYQMRADKKSNTGNKAIIDSISSNKLGLVFETDNLKEQILGIDENPTKKAFLVDVSLLTANNKPAAYKVAALHEVIDLEE